MDTPISNAEPKPTRVPSRRWYLLAACMLIGSLAVFVVTLVGKQQIIKERIEPMPRFVGPTDKAGAVVTIDQPGKINIFHENTGTFEGKHFNTPRRQVWTTFDRPSMTCTVTKADSGEVVAVRLPGVGEAWDKTKPTADLVYTYNVAGRVGHSAWVFDAVEAGDYRVTLAYVDAVSLEPGDVEIPAEVTKAEKKTMDAAEGAARDAARRDAMERASLAELDPIDVLFAVGPDPTRGGYFEVIGVKGAATILAFGFTFSILITLVTFMLRSGNYTQRGEMDDIKRLGESIQRDKPAS